MVVAAFAAAEAGQAARAGSLDEARAGFRRALSLFGEGGDLLAEALTGLTWALLAAGADPEAAAAKTSAEAFFTERGADRMLAGYRAAFVPVSVPATKAASPGRAVAESVRSAS